MTSVFLPPVCIVTSVSLPLSLWWHLSLCPYLCSSTCLLVLLVWLSLSSCHCLCGDACILATVNAVQDTRIYFLVLSVLRRLSLCPRLSPCPCLCGGACLLFPCLCGGSCLLVLVLVCRLAPVCIFRLSPCHCLCGDAYLFVPIRVVVPVSLPCLCCSVRCLAPLCVVAAVSLPVSLWKSLLLYIFVMNLFISLHSAERKTLWASLPALPYSTITTGSSTTAYWIPNGASCIKMGPESQMISLSDLHRPATATSVTTF